MTATRWDLDRIGFVLIALCLGIVQLGIAYAQSLLGLAAIAWLVVTIRGRERVAVPSFFWPLLLYALLTLVSAALSVDPRASFIDSRQLLLWLMVPIVARFCVGERAKHVIDVVIALGAAGAIVGIVQYTLMGKADLSKRPTGSLSTYMTYSGVLMLVTCAAVARLLFDRREWIWPAIAVPALVVALGATFARNAWAGVFVGIACLLALKNWKLVVLAPVLAAFCYVIAPASIKDRVNSILDPNDPTSRDRRVMLELAPEWSVPIRRSGSVRDGDARVSGYRPFNYVNGRTRICTTRCRLPPSSAPASFVCMPMHFGQPREPGAAVIPRWPRVSPRWWRCSSRDCSNTTSATPNS
jgi:hypothetical protein